MDGFVGYPGSPAIELPGPTSILVSDDHAGAIYRVSYGK